jgi:hypothetical protein
MKRILSGFSYGTLIPVAVLLGLAPFVPEPHLVEKLRMLSQGALTRPIDIFDLLFHSLPLLLLLLKAGTDLLDRAKREGGH